VQKNLVESFEVKFARSKQIQNFRHFIPKKARTQLEPAIQFS
jgi:hypothetical protein